MEEQTSMDWQMLKTQGADISGLAGVTVYVWYPFIVNTKPIRKDAEVVVMFDKEVAKKDTKRKEMNAFDQVKIRDRKRLCQMKLGSSSI